MNNINEFLEQIIFQKKTDPENNINIKDFSKELLDNDLIIQNYFATTSRAIEDYKYIPPHLLSNPMFVYSCLAKNPDIYLLADSKLQQPWVFPHIKELHYNYLKYATENELKDKDICMKSLTRSLRNFEFFPDYLKNNEETCLLIAKKFYLRQIQFEDHTHFAQNLPKHLLQNTNFVNKILNIQPTFISGLPKKILTKEQMLFCVSKNSNLFANLSLLLVDDKEIINTLLKKDDQNNDYIYFKKEDIIKKLPIKYFTVDFCEQYKKEIQQIFRQLPKSYRGDMNIIKAIYTASFNENENMFNKSYINYISNEPFKKSLIDFIQKYHPKTEAHKDMKYFIDYFMLNSILDQKSERKSILKI